MNNIFVVTEVNDEYQSIVAVFSTKELAQEFCRYHYGTDNLALLSDRLNSISIDIYELDGAAMFYRDNDQGQA